ncbi:hypothetical protein GYA13_03010 [Candidatus Kuenenbacteria bacterium]|nr:hypothetical protein [Candidatus Kuenenbacteria bacterium]
MRTKMFFVLVLAVVSFVTAKDQLQLGFHNQQTGWSPKITLTAEVAPKVTLWLRQGIGCSDPASLAGYAFLSREKVCGIFYVGPSAQKNLRVSAIRLELDLRFKIADLSPSIWLGYGLNKLGGRDDLGFLSACFYKPGNKNSFGYRLDGVFLASGQEQFVRAGVLWKYQFNQELSLVSWLGGEHKSKSCVLRIMLGCSF